MESLVATYKVSAVEGMEYFLRNFSHVPDERLDWSPTPTSKSAIRIAAHTAVTNGNFAKMLRERKLPGREEIPDHVARTEAAELAVTSRVEMEVLFRKNTAEVLAALDTLTSDELELSLDSGLGWSMPMTRLMGLAGWHSTLHAGQIDYLQTCWGDQQIYF